MRAMRGGSLGDHWQTRVVESASQGVTRRRVHDSPLFLKDGSCLREGGSIREALGSVWPLCVGSSALGSHLGAEDGVFATGTIVANTSTQRRGVCAVLVTSSDESVDGSRSQVIQTASEVVA